MEELKDTIDNGETEVQIATIGEVVGTGADGSPVEQKLTEEALEKLAEKHKDDELLVDADHESEVGGKTEAKGWLSGLKFIKGKGLFGTIHWTDIGKKLIENRVFRWLSPSWYLDKDTMEPIEMTSVALTNRPSQAGRIEPIVNSAPVEMAAEGPKEDLTTLNEETEEMTKEEITALVNELVDAKLTEALAALEAAKEAEVKEEVKEEIKEEVVDNACSEEKADEAKNEEPKAEVVDEKKEEVKEEVKEAEEKPEDKEVIKLEALNSQPKTEGLDIVKNSICAAAKETGYAIVTRVM